MSNILVDYHHSDLLYGLQRLFEDRLQMTLYAPVGHEWWDEWYWRFGNVFGDDRLAQQFLAPQGREIEPGLWLSFDKCHPERPIYSVTLERARTMGWSIVMASVDENQMGYAKFAREKGAQYLYHVGNTRQDIDFSLDPLVLSASEATYLQGVSIGQEFDHLTTFRYRPPVRRNRVVSFMNLAALIPDTMAGWDGLRVALPEFTFGMFGHANPDGFLTPVAAVAEEMARAGWAYHDKPTGDGFGHIVHNWAAVGRPLVGHASFYAGQLAEPLWKDGVTCIDLDRHSAAEAAEMMRTIHPDDHEAMCWAIRDTLEMMYEPEQDARKVRELLSRTAVTA